MKGTFTFALLSGLLCASSVESYAQQSDDQQRGEQNARGQSEDQQADRQPSNREDADTWREWWSGMWKQDQSDSNTGPQSRGIISQYIDRYDKDGDSLLSKEELPPRLQRGFETLDSNRDNKLSRSELQEHAGRRFRTRTSAPLELTYVWIIDADQGRTRMEELQKAYSLLRKIDKDGDGQLSREELRQRREQVVSNWCDECFDRLDENDDGELSRSEAASSAFAEQFSQYDQNGDSQLTKSEIHRYINKQFDSQSAAEQGAHSSRAKGSSTQQGNRGQTSSDEGVSQENDRPKAESSKDGDR